MDDDEFMSEHNEQVTSDRPTQVPRYVARDEGSGEREVDEEKVAVERRV